MTAVKRALYIEQGATFMLGFVWYSSGTVVGGEVVDGVPVQFLPGTEAVMQIRQSPSKPVLLEASTTNGLITLGVIPGRVDIVISAEDTAKLTVTTALYDLEIQLAPELRVRVLQGGVTIDPNITHIDPAL